MSNNSVNSSNVLSFTKSDTPESGETERGINHSVSQASNSILSNQPATVKATFNLSSQWLHNATSKLFDKIDDQLYQLSEKAGNSQEQSTYFGAMRLIRLRRSAAIEAFDNAYLQGFKPDTAPAKEETNFSFDEDSLSLMEHEDVEEDLAVTNMVSKVERNHAKSLDQLNQRIGYILKKTVDTQLNPLGPANVCNSLKAAIESLEVELSIRLMVFKLFDQHVISQIDELYDATNELLKKSGVLPNLKFTHQRKSHKQSYLPTSSQQTEAATQAETTDSAPVTASMPTAPQSSVTPASGVSMDANAYAMLQQLFAQNKYAGGNVPDTSGADYASTDEVVTSLANLPTLAVNVAQAPTLITAQDIKAMIGQSVQSQGHAIKGINQMDDDLIDMVGMLFDFILNDQRIHDSVKALISRMQLPVLKLAIQDKAFFSSQNHPARRFLSVFSNAGLGITETLELNDNPLYLKLLQLTNKVLSDFDSNPLIFDESLEDLERFMNQMDSGESAQANRSKGPSIDAINKLVNTEIAARKEDKKLPHVMDLLLDRVWQDVMVEIFVKHGIHSEEWDMAVTFINTLIWSVEPKGDDKQKQQLVKVIPGILNALNIGLDRIEYPSDLRKQLLQDLQACHMASLKGEAVNDAALQDHEGAYLTQTEHTQQLSEDEELIAEALAELDELDMEALVALEEEELVADLDDGAVAVIADHEGEASQPVANDETTDQARHIVPGTWLEFHGEENKDFRAKVSWISNDASTFIFITQTGQVVEKSLSGLTNALRSGHASIMKQASGIDEAIDALMDSLKQA